tara:strand:- start:180 stop:602 length:423 start_codon:yes stop_codon:yes gene_type:complete
MDQPIDGQQYTLIGDGSTPSIARGDSWEASKVTEVPKDDDTLLRETFSKLLSFVKAKSFIEPDKVTDEDAAGVLISKFFMWDPNSVYEVSSSAFEDSNYHSFNADMQKLYEAYKADETYKIEKQKQPVATPTTQDVEVCF